MQFSHVDVKNACKISEIILTRNGARLEVIRSIVGHYRRNYNRCVERRSTLIGCVKVLSYEKDWWRSDFRRCRIYCEVGTACRYRLTVHKPSHNSIESKIKSTRVGNSQ